MDVPDTRYAQTPDGAWIAFQVFGSGPVDVLLVPGFFTNLDENWRFEEIADVHRRIGAFARVIAVDRRGYGLSDRLTPGTTDPLEAHVDDLLAVLDAVQARRVSIFASETAVQLALLFAASYPARTQALALFAPVPAHSGAVFGEMTRSEWDVFVDRVQENWGTVYAREDLEGFAPSVAGDAEAVARWGRYLRSTASPGSAGPLFEMWWSTDVRSAYGAVQAPTLLMYRPDGPIGDVMAGFVAEAAAAIHDTTVVELPGRDLPYFFGDPEPLAHALEEFFTGARREVVPPADRALTTVLFTDIVGSTERAAAVGDRAWGELLHDHHTIVRSALARHRGREVNTAGDGFLATFDGPARAVRAALEAAATVEESLDIAIRAGVHTGEVEFDGSGVRGIAVHVGARIGALAAPGEVLVSSTVRDLTAGSGLVFSDLGAHELKGVPDPWRLYRAAVGNDPGTQSRPTLGK